MSVEIYTDRTGAEMLRIDDGQRHLDPRLIFVNAFSGKVYIARAGRFDQLGPPGRTETVQMVKHWIDERPIPDPIIEVNYDG